MLFDDLRATQRPVVMGPCVRRDDDMGTCLRDLAAHFARGLLLNSGPLPSEGAGNAGRPMRPPPRVRWQNAKSTRVGQVTPESPGIPRAMVLTASFVLSPATGLCCHRHPRNYFRELDASVGASGPHDFSVRFSTVRHRRFHVHRILTRVRDDREPPLMWDRTTWKLR
jgi:hypothetical protein